MPFVKAKYTPHANIRHGEASTYTNYGCRCNDCREAQRIAQIDSRARALKRRKRKK